jgi:hypothetical protein
MPTTYLAELKNEKHFQGNVVVRFLGQYYALRAPDSGLDLPSACDNVLTSITVNRSAVDPRRVSTTIASYTVGLADRNGVISQIVKDDGAAVIGQTIEIWVGRSGVSLPFSAYKKLPDTVITNITSQSGVYQFSSTEEMARVNKPIYTVQARLGGALLYNATSVVSKDSIASFPSSGVLKVEDEFIFYASKNNTTKTFETCARGYYSTTPAAHNEDVVAFVAEKIEANPIDIILALLISSGGGGTHDTLIDGCAISQALIDVAGMEALRDSIFLDKTYRLYLYDIGNALQFLEDELLTPNNLRFTYSRDALFSLAVLNSSQFVEEIDVIDHDSIVKAPKREIKGDRIVNQITIAWDYNEATAAFSQSSSYQSASSIAAYGAKTALNFNLKGLRSDLSGQTLADEFANALLDRLATPKPEISLTTIIEKSLINVGDKTFLRTTQMPNNAGRLNFSEEIEVVERAIDFQKGTVDFKLAFTSYTGTRTSYVAPANAFASITSQSVASLASGKGDLWAAGWKVRLWNSLTHAYETDAVNEISDVTGDVITFVDAWVTALTTDHKLKFADYDDCTGEQKRYAFVSLTGRDFATDERQYKII